MPLHSYLPGPPLSALIQQLWYYEGDPVAHSHESVLPDGSAEFVINLREDWVRVYDPCDHSRITRLSGIALVAPRSESMVIDTEGQACVMGVHFTPGGIFPFLGFPVREVRNQVHSLEDFWKGEASDLRNRLLEAPSLGSRFQILESALVRRAGIRLGNHPAVGFALGKFSKSPGPNSLSAVANAIGLSSRRFIEVFDREVGLTPKRFCRVRRFQQSLSLIRSTDEINWADLALNCGYFDQAHFIHDFRAFCGMTPTEYHAHRDSRHANHVPLEF